MMTRPKVFNQRFTVWSSDKKVAILLFLIGIGMFTAITPIFTVVTVGLVFIASVGVFLILKQSDWGILAALVTAGLLSPFLHQFSIGNADSNDVRLTGLLALGLLGMTLISVLLQYAFRHHVIQIHCRALPLLFLMGFVGLNIIALGNGIVQHGLRASLTDGDWLSWFGFFVLLIIKPSFRLIKRLTVLMLLITTVQSLQGIARLVAGQGTIYLSTGGERYVAGSTSLWIASGLVASLLILIYGPKKNIQRFVVSIIIILQATGILISFNRQTWVALSFALMFGFIFFFRKNRIRMIVFLVITVIVLVAAILLVDKSQVLPIDIADSISRRLGLDQNFDAYLAEPSMLFRIIAWQTAIEGIQRNPLIGTGWGSDLVFTVPLRDTLKTYVTSPHNTYLWFAYKAGILTSFTFVVFMSTIIFQAIQQFRRMEYVKNPYRYYLMGAVLSQITYLLGAFWWDYFSVVYLSIPIWLNTGVIVILSSRFMNNRGGP